MGFFSNLTGGGKGMAFSDSLKYVDDYKAETVIDEKGREKKRARYVGPWYFITSDERSSRTRMIVSAVLGFVAAACHVYLVLTNHYGVNKYPVILPKLLALFPLLYLGMGLASLPFGLKPMHRDKHVHSFMRASKSAIAVALMVGVSLAAILIYRIVEGDFLFLTDDWLLLGISVAEIAALIAVIRLLYTVEREERPNSAYDEGILK